MFETVKSSVDELIKWIFSSNSKYQMREGLYKLIDDKGRHLEYSKLAMDKALKGENPLTTQVIDWRCNFPEPTKLNITYPQLAFVPAEPVKALQIDFTIFYQIANGILILLLLLILFFIGKRVVYKMKRY